MRKPDDPYEVQSLWGAIAAFLLLLCFGFVLLQGFRVFVNIAVHGSDDLSPARPGDIVARVMAPLWGLLWVFAFLAFQADMFRRIAGFVRKRRVSSYIQALRTPSEALKAVIAVAFGVVYTLFLLGYYPFPSRPASAALAVVFALFSWAVSALLAWAMKKKANIPEEPVQYSTVGFVLGFVVGAGFFALGCFVHRLFYFHGMIGLGVLTLSTCRLLFRAPRKPRTLSRALGT